MSHQIRMLTILLSFSGGYRVCCMPFGHPVVGSCARGPKGWARHRTCHGKDVYGIARKILSAGKNRKSSKLSLYFLKCVYSFLSFSAWKWFKYTAPAWLTSSNAVASCRLFARRLACAIPMSSPHSHRSPTNRSNTTSPNQHISSFAHLSHSEIIALSRALFYRSVAIHFCKQRKSYLREEENYCISSFGH